MLCYMGEIYNGRDSVNRSVSLDLNAESITQPSCITLIDPIKKCFPLTKLDF